MKKTSTPIIFFGTEDFSLASLQHLIDAGFFIAAVITKPDNKKGRGQKTIAPPVKLLAEKHRIPVWQPVRLKDVANDIKALAPVAGVLVSYGKIIPQSIIDLFTPGIINVHPSLLPLYRGPSPIEAAIKNGDKQTGVSIMQLSAAMDAGPVYTAQVYPLQGTETRPQLYTTLAKIGAQLLVHTLPHIINSTLQPTPQNAQLATYCQLLQKTDTRLQANTITAVTAERIVRAHLGFPKTKVPVCGHDIIILKAHVATKQRTPLDIKCQDGAFLSIDQLIAPSGKIMDAKAFLRGYAA